MTNKNPLISIIVPINNVEDYLKECIDSIIAQTYRNLEIILVDDGSTDQSGTLADEYCKKDERITVIHKERGGLSSARNTGLRHSSGEWIAFVDSDDYIKRDFIAKLLNLAFKEEAEVATCNFKAFSTDGSQLRKTPTWPEKSLTGFESIDYTFKNRCPAYVCLCLFRKKLFKDSRIVFPENKFYEDIITKTKILFNAGKVAYSNEQLYCYRIRKGSITNNKFTEKHYNDYSSAIEDVKLFLKAYEKNESFRFLSYFEFSSQMTLLNCLSRESKPDEETKKHWKELRKKIKNLYHTTLFPTLKTKIKYNLILIIASNRTIYSAVYRKHAAKGAK